MSRKHIIPRCFSGEKEALLVTSMNSYATTMCSGNWTFDQSSLYDFYKLLSYGYTIRLGEFDPDGLYCSMCVMSAKAKRSKENSDGQLRMHASMMIFSAFKYCHEELMRKLGVLITPNFIKSLFDCWTGTHAVNRTNLKYLVHYMKEVVLACLLMNKCDIDFVRNWISRMLPFENDGLGAGTAPLTTDMCTIMIYSFVSHSILENPMDDTTRDLVATAKAHLGCYTISIYKSMILPHLRKLKHSLIELGYLVGRVEEDNTGETVAYNDLCRVATSTEVYGFY